MLFCNREFRGVFPPHLARQASGDRCEQKKKRAFARPFHRFPYSPKDKTFSALTRKTGDGLPFLDGLRFSKSSLETSTPLMK